MRIVAFFIALALVAGPRDAPAQQHPSPEAIQAVVRAVLESQIWPNHAAFAVAAQSMAATMAGLCQVPDVDGLKAAQDHFADLALAWSRIELWRFGPAREDALYERLFFWPDPRGRGLRHVQTVLQSGDPTALDPDRLRQKSVALQGLLALEYALFGRGAEALLGPDGATRCAYARTVATVIAGHAKILADAWQREDGYAAFLLEPGPDNPLYRTPVESLQEIVKHASELLHIVRERKLDPPLGEGPDRPRPRLAPYWRSDLVLSTALGNVDAVAGLLEPELLPALPADGMARWVRAMRFDLEQVRRTLDGLDADPRPWATLLRDPTAHGQLAYALIPLAWIEERLRQELPGMLGLIIGFNSLDGD